MTPPPLDPTVRSCSTLAALAYTTSTAQLERLLGDPTLPTGGRAGLAWGPQEHDSNRMYVAGGLRTEAGRARYVVSIRGTVGGLESSFENLDLSLVRLPWQSERYPDARISAGVALATQNLQGLRDGQRDVDLLQFLETTPDDAEIVVTGHSQGGCVASVVSLWLHQALAGSGRRVVLLTFGAQTAGEAHFAAAVNATFKDGCRYYNRLDVVPRAWAEHTLRTVADEFPGDGPKCDLLWRVLLEAVAVAAADKGFEQPARAHELPGEVYDERGLLAFGDEIQAQHSSLYYMWLTGVSLDAVQIVDPGWKPPPHG